MRFCPPIKIHLSTLYNPINCTFATEKGFKNFK